MQDWITFPATSVKLGAGYGRTLTRSLHGSGDGAANNSPWYDVNMLDGGAPQ